MQHNNHCFDEIENNIKSEEQRKKHYKMKVSGKKVFDIQRIIKEKSENNSGQNDK